ncbi:MAG: radical SAM protein [Candidatus Anstonellales archaeon]
MGKMKIDATFHYKKIVNVPHEQTPEYLEYRRKWKEYPEKHIAGDFPIHLDLESTSVCNLKCPMCFQSFAPPPPGFMKMELYKKIVDEGAKKGLCSLKLQYRGEPLLHPKIDEMVRYAKEKGILEVAFNTNATLLTEKMAKKLIAAGLDKIICSVDGYTPEVYEKIRVGAKFETVVNNIKTLQKIKQERGLTKPVVRVQMVDTPWNHHQIDEYIKYWGSIADHVGVEDMNDWHDKKLEEVVICPEFDCPMVYQRLVILYDGRVTICCGNIYGKLVAGDLNKHSVEEVWKGPIMQKLREYLAKGESHRVQICAECGYRMTVIKNEKMNYKIKPITEFGDSPFYKF